MKRIIDIRVEEFINTASEDDKGRIFRYLDLLEKYQFTLPSKYLKKLEKKLWELRPGNIRLLLGIVRIENIDVIAIVHIFRKKTNKTPKRELEKALFRLKEYQL